MLEAITIPETITVHLGRPNNEAENITLPFIDYIKNVASSEIFPTWSEEAIRANVYAQTSLALNRIYTQWYPSQGYNFDITNSTAFDQAFVKERNIFDNVSIIVDELFTSYLYLPFHLEPFYSEYCDGRKANCPGLKQWGTQDLATRGLNAYEILQYYYGDRIQIGMTNNIVANPSSYPNVPLSLGDNNEYVFIIQSFLNAIAINYPAIPLIYPPNGIFNEQTEAAVRIFQSLFDLNVDGIVGIATWNRISYIYSAVRELAQLSSLGRLEGYFTGLYTGRLLRKGDVGIEVQQLQYFLSIIAQNDSRIPNVSIDSRFGEGLETSVRLFQEYYGLISDGLVGETTWNTIYEAYSAYVN